MPYAIDIQSNGKSIFKEEGYEIYQEVKGLLKSKKIICPFTATLIPVRTNTCKNFAKDFFLPTVVNQVPRINNVAARIFAGLAALILDLITFPVRLLTCIPRVLGNSKAKNHVLHKFLVDKGIKSHIIDADSVKVELKSETKRGLVDVNDDGNKWDTYEVTEKIDVNFVSIPAKNIEKSEAKSELIDSLNFEDLSSSEHPNEVELKRIETELLEKASGGEHYQQYYKNSLLLPLESAKQVKVVVLAKEGTQQTPFTIVVSATDGETLSRKDIQKAITTCCKKAFNRFDLTKEGIKLFGYLYTAYDKMVDGVEKEQIYSKSMSEPGFFGDRVGVGLSRSTLFFNGHEHLGKEGVFLENF